MKSRLFFLSLILLVLSSGCILQNSGETRQANLSDEFAGDVIALQVPFYRQDSGGCVQADMRMALSYYYPDRNYSYEFLNNLTGIKAGKWVWLPQAYSALKELGVDSYLVSAADYDAIRNGGPEYIRLNYGIHADRIIRNTDFGALNKSIGKMLEGGGFIKTELSFRDLREHLKSGHLIIVMIDVQKIDNLAGEQYAGHAVLLTGLDRGDVVFHDPSGRPNRKVPASKFIEAWTSLGKPNDVIIMIGKISDENESKRKNA